MNATKKESIYIWIPTAESRKLTARQIDNRIAKLEAIREQEKALEKARAALEDEIKEAMGDAEHVDTGRFKVNWTRVASTRLDTKALKAERPDVYEAYAKEQQTRRFSYSPA